MKNNFDITDSFANISKLISKKYKGMDNDVHKKNAFLAEMERLKAKNELSKKQAEDEKSLAANNQILGAVKKLALGGNPGDPFLPFSNSSYPFPSNYVQSSNIPTVGYSLNNMGINPLVSNNRLYENPNNKSLTDVNTDDKNESTTMNYAGSDKPGYSVMNPSKISTEINPTTPAQKTSFQDLIDQEGENMYGPLAYGKGIEFLGKLALSRNYDVAPIVSNPYEDRVKKLSEGRLDLEPIKNQILAEQNKALAQISNSNRSLNVQTSMNSGVAYGTQQALTDANIKIQSANLQQDQQEANTLNNLGQQKVQARNLALDQTAQNKGARDNGLNQMFNSIGNIGQALTDHRAKLRQDEIILSTLKTNDFEFTPELGEALRSGKYNMYDFTKIMSTEKSTKFVGNYNAYLAKMGITPGVEVEANAKTTSSTYAPAIVKKQDTKETTKTKGG